MDKAYATSHDDHRVQQYACFACAQQKRIPGTQIWNKASLRKQDLNTQVKNKNKNKKKKEADFNRTTQNMCKYSVQTPFPKQRTGKRWQMKNENCLLTLFGYWCRSVWSVWTCLCCPSKISFLLNYCVWIPVSYSCVCVCVCVGWGRGWGLGEMELSNIMIHFLYILLLLIWHMYLYIIHC